MSESTASIRAEDELSWAEVVRRAEHGESVSVIAHGDHVADVVPAGELERLRETMEVLSDTELVRDLREGLADATPTWACGVRVYRVTQDHPAHIP